MQLSLIHILSQAETGWQPIQETIRKSDKDNRQYQAIRLDNGMVVLLVSDPVSYTHLVVRDGAANSHAAIMVRALGIPTVMGADIQPSVTPITIEFSRARAVPACAQPSA